MSGRGVGACEKLLHTCALASERNMTLSAVRHIFSLTVSFKFCKSQLQRWNLNTRTSATATAPTVDLNGGKQTTATAIESSTGELLFAVCDLGALAHFKALHISRAQHGVPKQTILKKTTVKTVAKVKTVTIIKNFGTQTMFRRGPNVQCGAADGLRSNEPVVPHAASFYFHFLF